MLKDWLIMIVEGNSVTILKGQCHREGGGGGMDSHMQTMGYLWSLTTRVSLTKAEFYP